MKILVTGGGGFLGTEICKQLLASGHQVISLQRSFSKTLESMGILQIQADLAVNESLNQSLNQVHDVEAVFHVAAKAGVWGSFESYYTANVVATENILIWSKNHRVKYFIYTSTPSVIFTKESVENADESIPYPEWFLTFYGQTKAKAEQMILSSQKDNFQVISLRPHLVFGAGDPHFVPRIIARAKANRLVQVGGGHNLVDVIHVSNAAYAHICALNYLMESPSHGGRAYFIGQERPVPLWWFISKIIEFKKLPPINRRISYNLAYTLGLLLEGVYRMLPMLGEPPMTRFLAMQLGTSHYFNQSSAIADLGYRPKITIEDGLRTI